MAALTLTQSQQSALRLPGTWRLEPSRAVTLRPREDGVLRVSHGRVWLTFDGPHGGPPNDQGDWILGAGEQVAVQAGRRIVLESSETGLPAYFSWDFAPQVQPARASRLQAVSQSWSDLQVAVALGLHAGSRLASAVVGLAASALPARPARNQCPAM